MRVGDGEGVFTLDTGVERPMGLLSTFLGGALCHRKAFGNTGLELIRK